jgi:diaminohydroxyphosphoribosylaminopyrimidine deaminase/5-amino-6-(5-phosphoribosylamino)uracil reductase
MMSRAITLARRGEGYVEPNPMVGCVIVRRGRIIGEGYHRRFGGPHAEINALRACRINPRGATVYVSLEPCGHFGKTPPCVDALIAARVGRVIAAFRDPNPLVSGRGFRKLQDGGIRADCGLLEAEAKELIAPFSTRVKLGRPYLIAKWAQSLDGKLGTSSGDSKWISCAESRRRVHRLRARVDAILVGSDTVLKDDPLLTARDVPVRRVALRAVLDGRLRISEACRLVVTAKRVPTLVFTGYSRATSRKADRLRAKGIDVVECAARRGRLSLIHCLRELHLRGATNVLVEGGPRVLSSFFESRLVDAAYIFVAPIFIGGDSHHPMRGLESQAMNDALRPSVSWSTRSGCDLLYRFRFTG